MSQGSRNKVVFKALDTLCTGDNCASQPYATYVSNPNSYPEWFQINEWPSYPLREAEIGRSHHALLGYSAAYHGCYSDFSTGSSSPVVS